MGSCYAAIIMTKIIILAYALLSYFILALQHRKTALSRVSTTLEMIYQRVIMCRHPQLLDVNLNVSEIQLAIFGHGTRHITLHAG